MEPLAPTASGRSGRGFYSWFAQDTWKITRKMTLDYGLRWDAFTTPREQYGRSTSLDPNSRTRAAGGHPGATIAFEATCNCDIRQDVQAGLRARLGLAYQIDDQDRPSHRRPA